MTPQSARLHEAETAALVRWAQQTLRAGANTFAQRQQLVARLGAGYDPDTGLTRFGFWAPELGVAAVTPSDVRLELLTPIEAIDFSAPRQSVVFRRELVELRAVGDYWWAVADGVQAGSRTQPGAFYRLVYRVGDDERTVPDVLAASIPYGAFAPAEVYDLVSLERGRRDHDHFSAGRVDESGLRRVEPPASILQLHIPTATEAGTIAGLTRRYGQIAAKLRRGEDLEVAEQALVGYDALQPLPIDPTIELREPGEPGFFLPTDVVDEVAGHIGVTLRKPHIRNWGYDNIVCAASATNPALLETLRPDELVELAEVLHTFPAGPVLLLYDVVFGHADNQAAALLNGRFFKGPNMYGQDLNHQDPTVRAILLEMQRRKSNTGCDGIRVDGAQDFRFYDPRTGRVEYDDDYLAQMSAVPQEVAGAHRRLWMIFEDGRPWPEEGWETTSTYRDVIEQQPEVFQWGPLIFAHNTPMLEGFWERVWWRIEQICTHGAQWISGCGNHDTLRRGTQVDPSRPLNRRLGARLPDILDASYDNPAVTLLTYGFLPGVPMDFLQASTRTPWGFVRDTDEHYGVKVVTEEAGFFHWQVTEEAFAAPDAFWRTKRHGLADLGALRALLADLAELVAGHEYHLDAFAEQLHPHLPRLSARGLVLLARDVMRDCHDWCNVDRWVHELDPEQVAFNLACRRLRRAHPWLQDNLITPDWLERHDDNGGTVAVGCRSGEDAGQVAIAVVLEGAPWLFDPADAGLGEGWSALLTTPGLAPQPDGRLLLADGDGVLLRR